MMTPVIQLFKKLKRFSKYSKSINGIEYNMAFTVKLATIEEEDAVDIYYEILCGDEVEYEYYPEIAFEVCIKIGAELIK